MFTPMGMTPAIPRVSPTTHFFQALLLGKLVRSSFPIVTITAKLL